ncbi:MAG: hypothetical protein IPL08_06045 [Saprospiraceae bacterium]|nr:hypothetical protein [Saprospiraceae bacterium]
MGTNDEVYLFNSSGTTVVHSIGWGTGGGADANGVTFPTAASGCTQPTAVTSIAATTSVTANPLTTQSISSNPNGSGTYALDNSPSFTAPNDTICVSYIVPQTACNNGPIYIKPRVNPVLFGCSVSTPSPTLATALQYTVTCPSAVLSGTQAVCGTSANLTVTFTNVVGTPNVTINYTKDGVPLVYGPVPYTNPLSIPVTMSGDYIITGVTFASGNCMASVSGMATVTLTPIPTAAITASTNISGCLPATSDDGTVTVSFGPAGSTGPWVITYSVNGVVYEATTTSNPYTFTTDIPGTYTLLTVEHESSGCSAPGSGTGVVAPGRPTVNPVNPAAICSDGSSSPVDLSSIVVNGSPAGGTIVWYSADPTGMSAAIRATITLTGTQLMVEPPVTQQYYFTYSLPNGCEVIGSITVTVVVCATCSDPVVSTSNACISGGTATFTQSGGDSGGTWSVSGGGTIDAATGVFTPSAPGCFLATYTTPTGGCTTQKIL